ncbi:MAG: cell division protein FtsZ [Bacteroidetes bacterium]|nr:cell division protein FtsZ [Bacteroidota bacterium]
MIQFDLPQNNPSNIIKVIGVGGGGGNAVNYMYNLGIDGVDFIVCNTDKKALNSSPVPVKIQLGPSLTQGLGAGANPEIGQKACEESIAEIEKLLVDNTKMVFVTAGMGGGTGTGGAPIMAKAAKDLGILTVGIVTTPFSYEGKRRMRQSEEGIEALRKNVDTILVISNDKLRQQFGNIAASQAFCRADDILATATKCITDVINSQGHIVVDFADVSTVMRDGGVAILGNATASGENRAYEAAEQALNSPLLNDSNISGAKWVLLNINSAHGIYEHTLDEVEMIQAYIQEQAGEDCDVIFGTGFDDNLGENISVTIIATGFEYKQSNHEHTAERMKPHFDKTKVTMTLGKEGEENKLFDTPTDQANATPMASVVSEKVEAEVEVSHDPLAPMMIEIEEPAIPSFMSIGFGMSNRKPMQPASTESEVETLTLLMPEASIETESFMAEFELPEYPEVESVPMEIYQTEDETKEVFTLQAEEMNIEPVKEIVQQEEKIVFELSPEIEMVHEEEKNEIAVDNSDINVQAELDALFSNDEQLVTNTPPQPIVMKEVEKTEQQMQDDYVTIKGITLNRKKGNRYLSDTELEAEAIFELQKRAFDERASRLRSMSFNVNNADIDKDESNIPAYLRQNKVLDTHPASGDDVYSNINVNEGGANGSHISTLNTFLNGKRPD